MERRAIAIHGTVQGVGFRPFVYGLASRLHLCGYVRNGMGGVAIEIEGEPQRLDQFLSDLTAKPPPLAKIEQIVWERRPPRGEREFRIQHSDEAERSDVFSGSIVVSPDAATCEQCLAELFDPADRHFRYPFLNCTHCGPRLTIVKSAPYDRIRTTMADFPMCPACRAEYDDPANRRFHAQPTACPACGPKLSAVDANGQKVQVSDPLAWFVEAIAAGKIGAMKGLGGYHLVCDAANPQAVGELRRRKHREEKPFAVMVKNLDDAREICEVSEQEAQLLASIRRPIVLLRRHIHQPGIAAEVAPGNPYLGLMLPYTPLHHLLMQDLDRPLVMTSGNRSDEPIAYEEPEVFVRLAGIAYVFLTHNRQIRVRCDDSVMRIAGGEESPIRRSRGYAPQPMAIRVECRQATLAVGGQLKNVFALGRQQQAILSHHMGDLDHLEAFNAFERDIELYEQLFEISPRIIAHDLHPDYASTRYALERAGRQGIGLIAVQHHHAHMAACMVENDLNETVIGICFDGSGYGLDQAIWGGEILLGDLRSFRRLAHLRYVPMPGGEQAVREPWRMALSHLVDAKCESKQFGDRIDSASIRIARQMIERRLNAPMTSSAGRLFDAVAALLAVRDRVTFEGQAAIELQWLAMQCDQTSAAPYPVKLEEAGSSPLQIDTRPLIRAICEDIARGVEKSLIARKFHDTLVEIALEMCLRARSEAGINKVVLSGGVFGNEMLGDEMVRRLTDHGFLPFRHRRVPANDGGLCLGQLAVAGAQM